MILIDFIDGRYPLLDFGYDFLCTESDEFKTAELNFIVKKIPPFSDDFFERWNLGWEIFFDYINGVGKSNKVIINKVSLLEFDEFWFDFTQISYIKK